MTHGGEWRLCSLSLNKIDKNINNTDQEYYFGICIILLSEVMLSKYSNNKIILTMPSGENPPEMSMRVFLSNLIWEFTLSW